MSKETLIIVLGILILIAPFVGLSSFIRTLLTVLFAGAVVLIGISLKAKKHLEKKTEAPHLATEPHHEELRGEE